VWWQTVIILALERPRQKKRVRGHSGLHSKTLFQKNRKEKRKFKIFPDNQKLTVLSQQTCLIRNVEEGTSGENERRVNSNSKPHITLKFSDKSKCMDITKYYYCKFGL
jgi:hypothetical protein